jgi:hypothetical protein
LIRFLAIGHVTNDLLAAGVFPGGSALYAGLTAVHLGARVRLITSFGSDFTGREILAHPGIHCDVAPSEQTTTFEERYVEGQRWARVLKQAAPLRSPGSDADVVFACPVIGEVDSDVLVAPGGAILGAGLQGWLRGLNQEGIVERRRLRDLSFLSICRVVFFSEQDTADDPLKFAQRIQQTVPIVVVTQGAKGARVLVEGRSFLIPAFPSQEVDPTGAGDTFAACFLLALAGGHSPLEAGIYASCGASIIVESQGPSGMSRLIELPQRLAWYREHLCTRSAD